MRILLLILILGTGSFTSAQYYGMSFSGMEVTLDQRSGLDLTPDRALKASNGLSLQFHIRFRPETTGYYGYIFRLLIGEKNIDLVHGIVPGNPNNFELILGQRTSRIAFNLPVEEILNNWIQMKLVLDPGNEKIFFHLGDTILEDRFTGYNLRDGIRLMFGAHSYKKFSSTDVPSMIIRDVELQLDKNRLIRWPLNEMKGSTAHSIPSGYEGDAFNPGWLLKQHNTWRELTHFEIAGEIMTAIDRKNDRIFIVSSDSIIIYRLPGMSVESFPHYSPDNVRIHHSLIYDTLSNQLLLYSIDQNYLSAFDFDSSKWRDIEPGIETVYWQHNSCIAPNGKLYIFGGYGQYTYKNSVLVWNPAKQSFDSVSYTGNFSPRYLAGSGFNPADSLLYFIGGFGSESGKQTESPGYYYDITAYSYKKREFKKITEFNESERGFCFARSVVFDKNNNLYGLSFDKFRYNNELQLIKVPLDNPGITELGNRIEFLFNDVSSFTDMYYPEDLDILVAVIANTFNDTSRISIQSISFPPEVYSYDPKEAGRQRSNAVFFIVGALLLLVLLSILILILIRRRKTSGKEKEITGTGPTLMKKYKTRNNSISLFGGFRVIDQNGKEITGKFTPLPKKLFLFILLHSLRDDQGVSSAKLTETFWFDKSPESARNNRAVNIVKIKSLLESLPSSSISKDTGYWKFDFDPSILSVDYYDYLRIVRSSSELSRKDIEKLLSIVENKPFLHNTQGEWPDPFKSDISNEIIDTFLAYINRSKDDPEFLLHLINCIFLVDPVSEEALKLKCKLLIKQGKHSLAKKAYAEFSDEYKILYDEPYSLNFKDIIGEKS